MFATGKKKKGWLVEWVEKASFDQLNKLFVISTSERHYQTLLTDQNLLSVVQKPQPYIIPIFPRLAPKVLVPNEHHVLKDLPLYEEARAINAKARQDQLDQRKKKHQEGTLRQALSISHSATSSTAHPLLRRSPIFDLREGLGLISVPFFSFALYRGQHQLGLNWLALRGGQSELGA